jgi:outer membrane receptor protein involved in Fe transport
LRAISKRGWCAVVLVVLMAPVVLAGTTGKISGVVTDHATGQPIPGAAVSVQGTVLGSLTDDEGRYVILNVPVGTYTLHVSIIGYRPVELSNVAVSVDLTTYESFGLNQEAVEMQPMTVTAERPLVIQDQTSSLRLVTEQDVANLPTKSYQEVVSLQAGVVRFADNADVRVRGGNRENSNTATMHIRGGRRSEVAYFVDGFSQQDPVTGLSTTQINQNAIQEIAVTTGGFNAEYGWISSGAINVTTKEGTKQFHGGMDVVTDNFYNDSYDYNNYSFNLSGPLWKNTDKGNFFVSGERRWQGDRSPRSTTESMWNSLGISDENRLPVNSLSGYSWQGKITVNLNKNIKWRSGILGSYDDWREYNHAYLFNKVHSPRYVDQNNSFFTRIVHTVNPKTFYTLSANYYTTERERGDGEIFDDLMGYSRPASNPQFFTGDLFWKYDDMYAWRLDSSYVEGEGDADSMLVIDTVRVNPGDTGAVFIHTPVVDTLVRAIIDSSTSPAYIARSDIPDIGLTPFVAYDTTRNDDGDVTRVDTTWGRGFTSVARGDEGHVWEDYLHRKSSYIGLDFDLTSQITPLHEMKFGMSFQRHTLRYYQSYFPNNHHLYWSVSEQVNQETGAIDTVVTNNGFKDVNHYGYDLFGRESDTLSEGSAARNPITFAWYLQDKFEWQGLVINAGMRFDYFNPNTDRLRDPEAPLRFGTPGKLDDADFEHTKAQTRWSPRLGIGFPISDRSSFHLSYGKFFQRPDLENLYMSRDYLTRMIESTPYFILLANPNLEPEKTTAYEVGYTQQLGDYTRLDITAFHKDIEDLTVAFSQNAFVLESPTSFGTFRNADWGTVRGLEIGLKMRRNHNIQMDLNYSLEYAKGTGSWPQTEYNIVWQNQNAPRSSSPLEFDQRHKLTANVDVRTAAKEGPKLGDFYPLENAGVNFVMSANSGTPYTPVLIWQEVSSAAGAPDPKGGINSQYSPWVYRVDLKANRQFRIGQLQWDLYLWVLNLFDRDNVIDVYESTGRPNTTAWLNTDEGQNFIEANAEPTERSGLSGEELWRLKEHDPLNYDTPRQIRFGVRVNF